MMAMPTARALVNRARILGLGLSASVAIAGCTSHDTSPPPEQAELYGEDLYRYDCANHAPWTDCAYAETEKRPCQA